MRTSFLILLFLPLTVWGEIQEIDSITEVIEYAYDNSLLLFDIDDTLICYPSHLGSTPWFAETCIKAREAGRLQQFHEMAAFLADHVDVVPVEPKTASVISQLQKRKVECMAITSRAAIHPAHPNWMEKTKEQLASIGVTFDREILFTDWKKGEVLVEYLEGRKHPGKIVLVDDRRSELERVEAALKPLEIPFLGLWYPRRSYVPYDALCADQELLELRAKGKSSCILVQEGDSDDRALGKDHHEMGTAQNEERCRDGGASVIGAGLTR